MAAEAARDQVVPGNGVWVGLRGDYGVERRTGACWRFPAGSPARQAEAFEVSARLWLFEDAALIERDTADSARWLQALMYARTPPTAPKSLCR